MTKLAMYFFLPALVSLLVIPFDGGIFGIIQDMLRYLFVPSSDSFFDRVNGVYTDFLDKLPFQSIITALESLRGVSDIGYEALNLEFDFEGSSIPIPIGTFLNPFLPIVRVLIEALTFMLLIRYNLHQMMFLIRGSSFYSSKGD